MVSLLTTKIVVLFSLLPLVYACVQAPIQTPIPVPKPRVFKKPLTGIVIRDIPRIDKARDIIGAKGNAVWKRATPSDKANLRILRDLGYIMYLAYQVAIAEGDQAAVTHYGNSVYTILKAEEKIINKYAPTEHSGGKNRGQQF